MGPNFYIPLLNALWADCLASLAKPKLVSVFIAASIPFLRLILQGRGDWGQKKTAWVREEYKSEQKYKVL